MSLIQTPWTSQPQQAVGIDWSNPLTLDIISAVHAPSLSLILPSGIIQRLSQNTVPNYGTRSDGVSLEFDGTNNSFVHSITPRSKQELTFVAWFYQNTSAVADKRICAISLSTASSSNHWSLGTGTTDGTKLKVSASNVGESAAGQVSNNTLKKVAATFVSSSMVAWDNGVQVASGVPAIPMTTYDRICYGSLSRLSNAAVLNGGIVFAAAWNRRLSAAEIKSVSDNPWQIFKPLPRRIFVPVSAGSSDTLLYPTKGSIVTSGYVPTITQPGTDTTLSPANGSLSISGKAPTLTQPNALTPSKAAAIFSGKQPTISQTANQTLSPSKVSLVFSGKTPTIDQTAANSILPGTGHYYTTGKTPTITQPNSIAPSKRAVALTGYQPTVLQSFSINPTTGAVVITGKTPSITQPNAITPLVAHAILTGKTPIISDSTPMTDSQKLDLIIDILSNKQTLNPTTGIYTLYADDGTTVLMTAQAWEDAAGTIPYRGKALQRLDAMS